MQAAWMGVGLRMAMALSELTSHRSMPSAGKSGVGGLTAAAAAAAGRDSESESESGGEGAAGAGAGEEGVSSMVYVDAVGRWWAAEMIFPTRCGSARLLLQPAEPPPKQKKINA